MIMILMIGRSPNGISPFNNVIIGITCGGFRSVLLRRTVIGVQHCGRRRFIIVGVGGFHSCPFDNLSFVSVSLVYRPSVSYSSSSFLFFILLSVRMIVDFAVAGNGITK